MKVFICFMVVFFCVFSVFSEGKPEGATTGNTEPIELIFWTGHYTEAGSVPAKPQSEWIITKAIEGFEKENPNIHVEYVILEGARMAQLIKAAGIAQNGPDLIFHWTGSSTHTNEQYFLPLNEFFTDEELDNITGKYISWKDFEEGTELIGIPHMFQVTGMFYNKALFRNAGVNDELKFMDMEHLESVSEKLKSTGVIPMAIGDQLGWNSAWFVVKQYLAKIGFQNVIEMRKPENSYEAQPAILETLQSWRDFYKAGYTNKDVMSLDNDGSKGLVMTEEAAMACDGTWALASYLERFGDDLGYALVPPLSAEDPYKDCTVGAPSGNFTISNYSKHPEDSAKFIKYMTSDKEQIEYFETFGPIPNSRTVDFEQLSDGMAKGEAIIYNKIMSWVKSGQVWVGVEDVLPVVEFYNEALRMYPLVLAGKLEPEEFMKRAEETRLSALKNITQ